MDSPYFFHRNERYAAELGKSGKYDHFFGYSRSLVIQNKPKKGILHQVVTLDLRDPILDLDLGELRTLPFVYCFQFESGENEIKITKLEEAGFDPIWPYQGYPARFPKIPFCLSSLVASTVEDFAVDVWGGVPAAERDHFICVVPQSDHYGFHLWKARSNFDDISTKFCLNPATHHVTAYNECD